MNILYITGTPGTGKTTLSKNLFNLLSNKDFDNLTYFKIKENLINDEDKEKIDTNYIGKIITKNIKFKDIEYIDITKFIKDKNISNEYDNEKECLVVDLEILKSELIKHMNNPEKLYLIDSHMTPYLNIEPNLQIVIKKDLNLLRKTLKERQYSTSKIEENLECEIFEINLIDSIENYPSTKTIELLIK